MAVRTFIMLRAGLTAVAVSALAACGSGSSDSPASTAASVPSSTAPSSTAPSTQASASATQTHSAGGAAPTQASPSTTAETPSAAAPATGSGMPSTPSIARPSAAAPKSNAAAGHDAPRRYTAAVWGLFTTPSGVQHCQVAADTASCYLSSAVMAQHQGSNVVLITKDGWQFNSSNLGSNEDGSGSSWATSGGVKPEVLNGLPVLPYGSSLGVGSYTCKSSTAGVTCTNGTAGFSLNSRGVTTTGLKASR